MQHTLKRGVYAAIFGIALVFSMLLFVIPVKAQETAHGGHPSTATWSTTIPAGVTVEYSIKSHAYLSFTPNPIGLGQELLVNMWLTPPSAENKYCAGYKVTIVKPDGSQDVIGPLNSYVADGTAWFTYIVDQVGEWKLKFEFPGQYFPAGRYLNGEIVTNTSGTLYPAHYYEPTSTDWQTLTVQNEQVMSWHRDLPTDYWSRPIPPNNREWYVIGGNWPWDEFVGIGGWSTHDNYYGPYVTAPNSAHIVWKRLGALAGIIGGEAGQFSRLSNPGYPSVIFMGRCYQTYTKPGVGSVAACYDLRTGEIYYEIPTAQGGVTPTYLYYWRGVDTAVPGAEAAAAMNAELLTISGSGANARLIKIDPYTGAVTVNVTAMDVLMFRKGYFLTYQTNNTAAGNRIINWTAQGSSSNFQSRIVSNISCTIPPSYRATTAGSYGALGAYDPESGITVIQSRFQYANVYGAGYVAVSLVTGQVLWNWTTSKNVIEGAYRPTNAWCRHGRYIAQYEQGFLKAFDLRTGKELWKSEPTSYPWGEFWLYDEAAYENLIYGWNYDGVYAFDENTGKIVWHWTDPAPPFETPYHYNGTECYSINRGIVADGKLYVVNSEHTPSQPATRGWGLSCLNATTGEFLWKISGANLNPGPAADGYLTAASTYDGYMYVIGKGKSKTTVEAPMTAVTVGQKVVIKGSVLDMSPAQPGTPCVAKESMAAWMDYLHMQQPIPAEVKGVSVSLDAVDPNCNFVHLGDVVTDGMSGTFGFTWTPEIAGDYKITATFMGDDSYGSSFATTYMTVVEAPQQTPTPEPPQAPPDYTWTIVGMGLAVIVAVAIVGVLLFRKRT
ncbi:MAG: PQQ-binding-like beta-propeller repeat protein [Candidatus Bathyarchaeia archaeon]